MEVKSQEEMRAVHFVCFLTEVQLRIRISWIDWKKNLEIKFFSEFRVCHIIKHEKQFY